MAAIGQERTVFVELEGVSAVGAVGAIEIHIKGDYARGWYEDAQGEAKKTDARAKRREIVFAVCFVESYLLEWVRDSVAPGILTELFPAKKERPVAKRWKEVTADLVQRGRIKAAPDLSTQIWQNFIKLLEYRKGLVHGVASRPQITPSCGAPEPVPTGAEIAAIENGWAVLVVSKLVRHLHAAAGDECPEWIEDV